MPLLILHPLVRVRRIGWVNPVVLRHTELLGLKQLVQLIPLPLLPIHQHPRAFLLLRIVILLLRLVTHQLVLLTRQLVLATHLLRLVTLQIVHCIVQPRLLIPRPVLVIPRPVLAILLRAQELRRHAKLLSY